MARLARLERAASCLEGVEGIVIYKEIAFFRWTGKAKKGTIADRMRTRRERNTAAGRDAVVKKKIPNIYPPEFPDPLLPGGIPAHSRKKPGPSPDPDAVARDAYLGQLAADVGAGEADPPEPEGRPGGAGMEPPKGKAQGGGS